MTFTLHLDYLTKFVGYQPPLAIDRVLLFAQKKRKSATTPTQYQKNTEKQSGNNFNNAKNVSAIELCENIARLM